MDELMKNESLKVTRYAGDMIPLEQFEQAKTAIYKKHQKISKQKTDKKHVETRPDNFDYVKDDYMRDRSLKDYGPYNFVQVSLEIIYSTYPQAVGNNGTYIPVQTPEWIIFTGHFSFYDEGLPRVFPGTGASRVQYKKHLAHTPDNIIDLDKQVKAARTQALKDAINRSQNIADDVYRKEMEDVDTNTEPEEAKVYATEEQITYLAELYNKIDKGQLKPEVLKWFEEVAFDKLLQLEHYNKAAQLLETLKPKKGEEDE